MTPKSQLSELENIGPTVEKRLNEIGILTPDDLKRIGPAVAYRQMKENAPDATLPRCYYLYSLEGALRGVHWDALPVAVKDKLSKDAGITDR